MKGPCVQQTIDALADGQLPERLVLGDTLFAPHLPSKQLARLKFADAIVPAHAPQTHLNAEPAEPSQ